jgi:hypothetical protein
VSVQQRFDQVAQHRFDHQEERRRPQQHGPAGVHCGRERQRNTAEIAAPT